MEVFVRREAYMVDAAETRFGRVLHSVKTIIYLNFQIINPLKFYSQKVTTLSVNILSGVPFLIPRA